MRLKPKFWLFFRISLLLCFISSLSQAEEILFVRTPKDLPSVGEGLTIATRFYGLQAKIITVQNKTEVAHVLSLLREESLLGAAVTAEALTLLPRDQILAALQRRGQRIPLLVLGLTQDSGSEISGWSHGDVSDCESLKDNGSQTYVFAAGDEIIGPLANQEIPAARIPDCSFTIRNKTKAEPLLFVRTASDLAAVFVRDPVENAFYVADMRSAPMGGRSSLNKINVFSEIAPFLLFSRYAAGDKGWHSVGHYANLSIDDPWLSESYGHVHYAALLQEMQRHNFHTTISFIPWNFDRSRPDTAKLFREHNDRFSICVHGNNHNHKEFGDEGTVAADEQVANIRQAIARMEKFTQLTGVSYDRVMVFPHTTAPETTLAQLKKYGFLATAYSLDLPAGVTPPTDPLFYLRSFNQDFANLLGLDRYYAEGSVSRSTLAIDSFLGNPILFYGHESLFTDGIGSFNHLAEAVNSLQPDTHWCSLGCIAQHAYLARARDDGNVDAEIFSSSVVLENQTGMDKTFFVRKAETFAPPIETLTVDGMQQPFTRSGDFLTFSVLVPARKSQNVRIRYLNDWNASETSVAKKGIRVAVLRNISDFRDMTLSRFGWGRALTGLYYHKSIDSFELKFERAFPVMLLCLAILAVLITVAKLKRRRNPADVGPIR